MTLTPFFTSPTDGIRLGTRAWTEAAEPVRGVVQIAHGLAEHSARYGRLAAELNRAGYLVYAADHRGHGESIVEVPGDFGEPGFDGLIADVAAFGAAVAAEHEGLPLFLIAHSMGSFAAQSVILDHSEQYAGVVLSGSSAVDVLAAGMAEAPEPAGLEAFNADFEQRTGYEWLSRDEAEVDKYVADPLCGFDPPEASMMGMFSAAATLGDTSALARIRPDLPVLIASGEADPLSGAGQLVQLLGQRYRDAGLQDVTVNVYDGARHEIFNETNREEITAEIARQDFSAEGTGEREVLRFLAAPTDVNWGGKVHGGIVMEWIDEAAYLCATRYCGRDTVAVFSGGIRFMRPLHIGDLVEVDARLIYTGTKGMHIAVEVRSGDPKSRELEVTTNCLTVMVARDEEGTSVPVPAWEPVTEADKRLWQHARTLLEIRSRAQGNRLPNHLLEEPGESTTSA